MCDVTQSLCPAFVLGHGGSRPGSFFSVSVQQLKIARFLNRQLNVSGIVSTIGRNRHLPFSGERHREFFEKFGAQ